MRRRIMETHKHGVTKVVNAGDEPQVNPTDPLYGELRIADILRGSLRPPVDADLATDDTEPKMSEG
jgi:hypothetical protein